MSTAFGRSLPFEVQQSRSLLATTGQQTVNQKATQLWKINDEKAGKNGNCQAVYWVKERKVATELKRQAKPEKVWDTGTVYKGEWKANLKHGYGIQIWSNGNKYEGEWAFGNREGHGVFWLREKVTKAKEEEKTSNSTTPSRVSSASSSSKGETSTKLRRVYAGNWKNDLKHGTGVYFYPDGSRYEGSWECDQRCGRGTLYMPSGDQYTGEWKNGLQNGFGTLTKSNKDVYEGEWLNGLREGSGIYYYKSQEKIYDGEWVNDQPKCGVYLDAREFFDDEVEERKYNAALGKDAATLAQAARDGDPSLVSPRVPRNRAGMPIPRLRMLDADGILAQAIENVTIERAAVRALPHTSLGELFSSQSIDALRRIFASYDANIETGDGSGLIQVKHLPRLLDELSLPKMDPPTFARLCTDLRKKKPTEKMTFQDFVRAVHIAEEERNNQQHQTQEEED